MSQPQLAIYIFPNQNQSAGVPGQSEIKARCITPSRFAAFQRTFVDDRGCNIALWKCIAGACGPLIQRVQSRHSMGNRENRLFFRRSSVWWSVGVEIGLTKKRRLLQEYAGLRNNTNTYSGKDASMQDHNLFSLFW